MPSPHRRRRKSPLRACSLSASSATPLAIRFFNGLELAVWRPSVLKSSIGCVHRVSSHDWFHRPDDERARLATAIRAALN